MRAPGLFLIWSLGLLVFSAPAHAAVVGDCAPIGTLENFEASNPPQTWVFARQDFRELDGKDTKTVQKTGKTCLQHYALKSGAPRTSNLEIMRNYEDGLPGLGFRITNSNRSPDDDIFATMTKGGIEYWAHVWSSNADALHILVLQVTPFAPTLNPAVTAQDCAPIQGLRDFAAGGQPQTWNFKDQGFRVREGNDNKTVVKMGATCSQDYSLQARGIKRTNLEIMQNYAQALPQQGWTITNTNRDEDDDIFATQTKDGVEYWAQVGSSNGDVLHVMVLRIEPFKPSLVPLTAQDCAPIKGLRDFAAAGPPRQKPYDQLDFRTVEDGQPKKITKSGKTCQQDYTFKAAPPKKTNLEIMQNYATALPDDGWTITNPKRDADDDIFATLNKDGVESWVHVWSSNGDTAHVALLQIAPFKSSMKAAQTAEEPAPQPAPPPAPQPAPAPPKPAMPVLTLQAPAASPEAVPDQGDFPYLPSVPGSKLIASRSDAAPFYVQPTDAKQPELVANGSILKEYQSPPGLAAGQLLALYHTALLRAHWSIVSEQYASGVNLSAHYGDNGRNIWATLHLAATEYNIRVADATIAQNQLAADLGSKCHLALTGVLFDFNKSTLKPESDAVLRQVAALMTQNPALKLEIQGHTDNVGSDAYNQPLSEARAHAVVSWLALHQVAPTRLTARGYGKTKPIATNATDEGRAQNRRVEIANPACKM